MENIIKKESGTRYYEIIIDKIRAMISSGQLKCGEKLPSERELAERWGVSRVPVREAIKILEYMGVLDGSGGDGMYVRDLDIHDLIEKLNLPLTTTTETISDLMELRCSLEATAAGLAAMRRTHEDLEEIRASLDRMRAVKQTGREDEETIEELRRLSNEFHLCVIKASKNRVLISIYRSLFELLDISRQFTIGSDGISYDSILAHEAIFHKIKEQNAEGARSYMGEHMEVTRERLHRLLSGESSNHHDISGALF